MTTTPTKSTKPVAPLSVPVLATDLDAGLRLELVVGAIDAVEANR
jgi:hypothetical protein